MTLPFQNSSDNQVNEPWISSFYKHIIIRVIVSLGGPYASSICSIFPPCMESNTWEKSTNTSKLFGCTPMIWRIVRIFEGVDQFLQKPFWFYTHTHTHTHIYIYIYIYNPVLQSDSTRIMSFLEYKTLFSFYKLIHEIVCHLDFLS